MTSVVLAQKLGSVKLSKDSFEKVRCLISNNIENKLKMVPCLKKVLDNQNENMPCRICLKPGRSKIFDDKEFDYARAIKNLLGIEVKENDGKPQHICTSCKTTLKEAEQLKQTAEVTQWRLQQELEMITGTHLECEDKNHHGSFLMEQGKIMLRKWSCGKCKRAFDNQEAFTDHDKLLTCRKEKQIFVCETCGIELKTLSRLKRHSLTHSTDSHYSSKYSHRGTKSVQCKSCSRAFHTSSNLASHRLNHVPANYRCINCTRSLKFKQTHRNHTTTQHSPAKPHACNMCEKAFSTRKMLLRHERNVHKRPNLRPGLPCK